MCENGTIRALTPHNVRKPQNVGVYTDSLLPITYVFLIRKYPI